MDDWTRKANQSTESLAENGTRWLARQNLPGQALICGSAPTLVDDLELARLWMPEAAVIAVNESARIVKADFLVTQHPEKALWFRSRSLDPDIEVHTGKSRERAVRYSIDVYWPDCTTLATSGGSAIAIALKMGFQKVLLCGMPMNGGDGYFRGSTMRRDEPRFGMESPDSEYIQGYKKKLVEFTKKQPEVLRIVRSMSGFTRELFGAPEWLNQTKKPRNPETDAKRHPGRSEAESRDLPTEDASSWKAPDQARGDK